MHVPMVLNISFYNLFQISKQGRMTSKVTDDYHHQLMVWFLLVINNKTGVGVDINLELGRVSKTKWIPFMSLIWLGAGFDIGLPQVGNGC